MTPVISIVADIATKVGAPIIKSVLGKHVGGLAGSVAGTIVDQIADRIGVSPEQLPDADPQILENVVRDVEVAAPELIALYSKGLEGQFALLQAEAEKETIWASAWRWGWMYLLAFFWCCAFLLFPIARSFGVALDPIDAATLMTLTGWFISLYMGGHTVKEMGRQAVEAVKTWRKPV